MRGGVLLRVGVPLVWASSFIVLMADQSAPKAAGRPGLQLLILLVCVGIVIGVLEPLVVRGIYARPWTLNRRAAASFGAYWACGLLLAGVFAAAGAIR